MTADADLNARLSALLITASVQIGDAIGTTLIFADDAVLPDVAEPIKTAIKFRVAAWYENPVPDAKAEESAQKVVDTLISKYRKYTYPDTDAPVTP